MRFHKYVSTNCNYSCNYQTADQVQNQISKIVLLTITISE